jgi:Arb2 domain
MVSLSLNCKFYMLISVDIIREWQARHLYDDYRLTNLHIFRSKISRSFNHQVLATSVSSLPFAQCRF